MQTITCKIVKRNLYYCCRLVSSQYGTEFTNSHYEKIKKVYSIFICMNPPNYRKNTINQYSIQEEFNIKMTQELEREVSEMCNLSEGIEEKGIERGQKETEKKIILNMSRQGFTSEQIAAATEKTISDIEDLLTREKSRTGK